MPKKNQPPTMDDVRAEMERLGVTEWHSMGDVSPQAHMDCLKIIRRITEGRRKKAARDVRRALESSGPENQPS